MKAAKTIKKTKQPLDIKALIDKGCEGGMNEAYYSPALLWLFDPNHKPTVIEGYSNFLLLNREGEKTEEYKEIETLDDFKEEVRVMSQKLPFQNFMKLPETVFGPITQTNLDGIKSVIQNELAEHYDHEIIVLIDAYNRVKASDTVLRESIDKFNKTRKQVSEGSYVNVV